MVRGLRARWVKETAVLVIVLAVLAAAGAVPAPMGVERFLKGDGFVMALGTERGECPEGEKVAIFARGDKMVPGCWFEKDKAVWIWWLDGDFSALPSKAFTVVPQA